MEKSNLVTLKFKSRNASNPCDKGLAEQYNNGGPFDVELQTTDGKSVSAHRFVLAIFSKTWANALRTAGLDGVIALPIAEPYNVAKKLIELLYLREINVLEDEKQPILNALKLLKVAGVDDAFKVPQIPPYEMGQQMPMPAKIPQQRRASVQVVSQTAAKRTAQRAQSVRPDQLREHNMAPPSQQRPPNMNVAQNPNRNSMNVAAGIKLAPQVSLSKVPRPVNGGSVQATPVRQQPTPPPPPQTQVQMVTQNRQPMPNQMAVLGQMQNRGVTVKKQIPAAAAAAAQKLGPSPQKPSANVQATPIQSKIPTGLPAHISVKSVPRNNQQQQQQQQSALRTVQTQPEVTMIPISLNHTDERSVALTAAAAAVIPNGQVSQINRIDEEIDNLPIDMEIDVTIGNGKTNDDIDDSVEQMVDNGANADQAKVINGMDEAGIGETVVDTNNNNAEGRNEDQIDHDDVHDDDNDFDGEDFEDYDDTVINNSNNIEDHDLHNVLSDMQVNEAQ